MRRWIHPAVGPGITASSDATSIVLIGDSHTTSNGNGGSDNGWAVGFCTVANMLLGGSLDLRGIFATGGYTIEQIANTHLPRAVATDARWIHILAGGNNLGNGDTASVCFDKLINLLIGPLLSAKRTSTLIVGTTIPGTGISNKYQQAIYDQLIRDLPRKYPNAGVLIVDYNRIAADPITANWRTGFSTDGVHANNTGQLYLAQSLADIMAPFMPSANVALGGSNNFDGAEYFANPRCNGNNASGTNKFLVAAGVTGTGPESLNISRTATGTATCVGDTARIDNLAGGAFEISAEFAANADSIIINAGPAGSAYFPRAWTAATVRTLGEYNIPTVPNGFIYRVVAKSGTGTTGASQPTWPTSLGQTVTDNAGANQIIWQCMYLPQADDRFIATASFSLSAVSGQIAPRLQIGFEDLAFSGTLRPTYENGNDLIASTGNSINGMLPSSFGNLFDAAILPINKILTIRSPVMRFPDTCVNILPTLRIYGTAGSTCTLKYHGTSMRYLPS